MIEIPELKMCGINLYECGDCGEVCTEDPLSMHHHPACSSNEEPKKFSVITVFELIKYFSAKRDRADELLRNATSHYDAGWGKLLKLEHENVLEELKTIEESFK